MAEHTQISIDAPIDSDQLLNEVSAELCQARGIAELMMEGSHDPIAIRGASWAIFNLVDTAREKANRAHVAMLQTRKVLRD